MLFLIIEEKEGAGFIQYITFIANVSWSSVMLDSMRTGAIMLKENNWSPLPSDTWDGESRIVVVVTWWDSYECQERADYPTVGSQDFYGVDNSSWDLIGSR